MIAIGSKFVQLVKLFNQPQRVLVVLSVLVIRVDFF